MTNISLAVAALLLSISASAQECATRNETHEGKSYALEICVGRVEDVIKTTIDGFVKIDYIVQYKGQRLAVEDPLAQYDHAVGEQMTFMVGKHEMPADSNSRGYRLLMAIAIEPGPEAKPTDEECPPSTGIQPFANETQALGNGYVPISQYSNHLTNLRLDYLHHLEINDIAGLRTETESWLALDVPILWASIQDANTSPKDRDQAYGLLRLIAIEDEKFPVAKWNSDPKLTAIFHSAIDNDPAHAELLRRQNWNKPHWVGWVD